MIFRKSVPHTDNQDADLDSSMPESLPLETQLEHLSELGIKLKQGLSVDDLLKSFERDEYEANPYKLLLCVLGASQEVEPYGDFSDDVYHLDTECIENQGDYVKVAEKIIRLTGGELVVSDLEDDIELSTGKARLSFKIGEHHYDWQATVNDDWLDPAILARFAMLAKEHKLNKPFCCHYFEGQDCLLTCMNESDMARLTKLTGLKFNWLE
ncbi:MAG: hypothetical protein H6677_21710 [Candidatus Obscuribacterales bacterium]|nr:hypothetical protein [Cyanobacteria bacterium HKST-UBA01]MCB9470905.1 hypothetical protein [Candidatus Obscuribacterales bacterium]